MSVNSIKKLVLIQTIGGMRIPVNPGDHVILGRSRLTKIKDKRLSKRHLKLLPVINKNSMTIEHIGRNFSTLKGVLIKPGFVGSLSAGDKFELLEGQHEFQLVMETENNNPSLLKPNNHWSNGLLQSMNDPNMIWYQNEDICIIKDKYPKSKYHFLVLPRKENISSLKKLKNQHISLVENMIDSAKTHVIKGIVEKNSKIRFRCGFHAIPSMAQVHMHVISQDFISPCLKTKRHWNSFNTPYFVEAEKVLTYLSKDGLIPNDLDLQAKTWLAEDVKCHLCPHKPKGMGIPFKQHLESHSNA